MDVLICHGAEQEPMLGERQKMVDSLQSDKTT